MRAGVHRSTISLVERGQLEGVTLPTLRRCLAALEVQLVLAPRWRGADLDRLLDEDHGRLQAAWKGRLERRGWMVIAEASFNRYGDRGRVDLLAWHPVWRVLLVVEIKTLIADAQGLLGSLDVKLRVAGSVAHERGWGRPAAVVPMLVVAESSTNRRRIASLEPLFSRFSLRGRAALAWLRHPDGHPTGILALSDLPPARHSSVRRVGRTRVRRSASAPSVDGGAATRLRGPGGA